MSEENKQAMESAIQTLNQLATSHSTPKNFKKTISDLIIELQTEEYIPSYGCDSTYTRQLGTFKVVGDFSVEEADIDIINNNFMWFGADFSSGNIEVLDYGLTYDPCLDTDEDYICDAADDCPTGVYDCTGICDGSTLEDCDGICMDEEYVGDGILD